MNCQWWPPVGAASLPWWRTKSTDSSWPSKTVGLGGKNYDLAERSGLKKEDGGAGTGDLLGTIYGREILVQHGRGIFIGSII